MLEEYKDLIDAFSKLNRTKKQTEIRDELQELLMLFHNISDRILVHTEMEKLEKDNITEEEFLNGIYAYIISAKESIGQYLSNE